MSDEPPKDYLLALGSAAYTWAHLEGTIDFIVAVTYHRFDGRSKHPEIPRSLGRKLGYLRDISKLKPAQPFRDRIAEFATAVANLKEERHDAIHGAAVSFSPEGAATLRRFLYEKHIHGSKTVEVSPAKLKKLSNRATALAEKAIDITADMLRHVGVDMSDYPAR